MANSKRQITKRSSDGKKKKYSAEANKSQSNCGSSSTTVSGSKPNKGTMKEDNGLNAGLFAKFANMLPWSPKVLYEGLQNQGQTCCLNSICQILFMIPEFRETILSMAQINGKKPSILAEFGKLFQQLGNKNRCWMWGICTKNLTNAMGWRFGGRQRDANELFIEILGRLEMEAAQFAFHRETKFCGDIFKNKLVNMVHCLNCGFGRRLPETMLTLPLLLKDLDGRHYERIDESLCAMINSEYLFDDIPCKYCGKTAGVEKNVGIVELAPVVALQLLRFQGQRAIKSNVRMFFPIDRPVNFSPFMETSSNAHSHLLRKGSRAAIYQLFAVIVHSGSICGGHYWAYIKESTSPYQWYCFNDSHVSHVDSSKLETLFGDPGPKTRHDAHSSYRRNRDGHSAAGPSNDASFDNERNNGQSNANSWSGSGSPGASAYMLFYKKVDG